MLSLLALISMLTITKGGLGGQWSLFWELHDLSSCSWEPRTLSFAGRLEDGLVGSQHKDEFSQWAWQTGLRETSTFYRIYMFTRNEEFLECGQPVTNILGD